MDTTLKFDAQSKSLIEQQLRMANCLYGCLDFFLGGGGILVQGKAVFLYYFLSRTQVTQQVHKVRRETRRQVTERCWKPTSLWMVSWQRKSHLITNPIFTKHNGEIGGPYLCQIIKQSAGTFWGFSLFSYLNSVATALGEKATFQMLHRLLMQSANIQTTYNYAKQFSLSSVVKPPQGPPYLVTITHIWQSSLSCKLSPKYGKQSDKEQLGSSNDLLISINTNHPSFFDALCNSNNFLLVHNMQIHFTRGWELIYWLMRCSRKAAGKRVFDNTKPKWQRKALFQSSWRQGCGSW
jgi:hypothetical protein